MFRADINVFYRLIASLSCAGVYLQQIILYMEIEQDSIFQSPQMIVHTA